MPLDNFNERKMTFLGETKTVFHGGEGSAVIVMHELPGLHPGVIAFGRRVIKAGFSVYMPSLVGTPDKPFGLLYNARSILHVCVSKEFKMWAAGRTSPVTAWLRELAHLAHKESGGPGVGAIGMCLTGGFALAMMVDDVLLAPVLSQPSLPLPLSAAHKADLGIDADTLAAIKKRAEEDDLCVLGLRFTGDRLVPGERFQRLRDELGDRFLSVEIDSGPKNPHHLKWTAHSVLTLHFVDDPSHPTYDALERVLSFFRERLSSKPPT